LRKKTMLSIENLHAYYGGIHALDGVSLAVSKGKIATLIGANGAGKSTTLRAISGLVQPGEGKIVFEGADITGMASHEVLNRGVAMVPEGRKVFTNLTVMENLLVGAHTRTDARAVREDLDWVCALFPILSERASQSAGTLSGGEQQMLAVGRALMSRPKLLLMDEPSLGLAPNLVMEVIRTIKRLNEQGMSILLVEQNARAALRIADYAYILETGRIVLEGPGHDLIHNDDVRKAYLGIE
jgi:branched-chain amino acid transport system ATP-binding protein